MSVDKAPLESFNPVFDNFLIKKRPDISDYLDDYSNFYEIPPVIGFIVSTKEGLPVIIIEYLSIESDSQYFPIEHYLIKGDRFNLELLTPFFTVFENALTETTNMGDLTHLELRGSKIKIHSYFAFEDYTLHIILNANTHLSYKIQSAIINRFRRVFAKYHNQLCEALKHGFRDTDTIKYLRSNGREWLKRLNELIIRMHKRNQIDNFENFEDYMLIAKEIINTEIKSYFRRAPSDLIRDLVNTIETKMGDKWRELYKDR